MIQSGWVGFFLVVLGFLVVVVGFFLCVCCEKMYVHMLKICAF